MDQQGNSQECSGFRAGLVDLVAATGVAAKS